MSRKFYGEVGYAPTVLDDHGVARPKIIKRMYYGDVDLNSKWETNEYVNDDIVVGHRISILADEYAVENFPYIKYVKWMGTRWLVKKIEVQSPRLILTLGGVYNG